MFEVCVLSRSHLNVSYWYETNDYVVPTYLQANKYKVGTLWSVDWSQRKKETSEVSVEVGQSALLVFL